MKLPPPALDKFFVVDPGTGHDTAYAELSLDSILVGWMRVAFRPPTRKKRWWDLPWRDESIPQPHAVLNIEYAPGGEPPPPIAPFVDDLFEGTELPFLIRQITEGRIIYLDRHYDLRWLSGQERRMTAGKAFGEQNTITSEVGSPDLSGGGSELRWN